ncbi:MAG: DUF2490 domain-containing protein [Planctomycetota bacterium]|jgi:hypothetical protein
MKTKNRTLFTITAIITVLTSGICFAVDDNDFHYWSSVSLSFDIHKDWKAIVTEELRLIESAGNLAYHHTEAGFVYSGLADWLDLGFDYRHIYGKDSSGTWSEEHRPQLNAILKGNLLGIDFTNRSRFEFRDRQNKDDGWLYRNKLTLKFPMELTALKLKPYIADEVFFILDEADYTANRLYAGFSIDLAKNLKGKIFYMWQTARVSGADIDINVIGTNLTFSF